MVKLNLYIIHFIHEKGNGYALVKAHSTKQAESIFSVQTVYKDAKIVTIEKSEWHGENTQLVKEGAVTTLGQSLYEIAVANGFIGTVDEFLESMKGEPGESLTYEDLTDADKDDLVSHIDTSKFALKNGSPEEPFIAEELVVGAFNIKPNSSGTSLSIRHFGTGHEYTFPVQKSGEVATLDDIPDAYTKTQTDDKFATNDDLHNAERRLDNALATKANSADLANVATSGSYNDLLDKPSVAPQEQADWTQEDSTAVDYIKHKPSVYTKSEVDALCPLIEDTRSSAAVNITGVAPFESLVDGQRVLLHIKYNTLSGTKLVLTLTSGQDTEELGIKVLYNSAFSDVGSAYVYLAGAYIPLIYDATSGYWVVLNRDTNSTYNSITQSVLDAGTVTGGMLVSPKLLRDNFYTKTEINAMPIVTEDEMWNTINGLLDIVLYGNNN